MTLIEVLQRTEQSYMQNCLCNLINWTNEIYMQVNTEKKQGSAFADKPAQRAALRRAC